MWIMKAGIALLAVCLLSFELDALLMYHRGLTWDILQSPQDLFNTLVLVF